MDPQKARAHQLRLLSVKDRALDLCADVTTDVILTYYKNPRVELHPFDSGVPGFKVRVSPMKKAICAIRPAYDRDRMKPAVTVTYAEGEMTAYDVREGAGIIGSMIEQCLDE